MGRRLSRPLALNALIRKKFIRKRGKLDVSTSNYQPPTEDADEESGARVLYKQALPATRGGPIYYTQALPTWAFFKGIEGGALAEGAAIALFLFPLLLAMAILILRGARRMEVT